MGALHSTQVSLIRNKQQHLVNIDFTLDDDDILSAFINDIENNLSSLSVNKNSSDEEIARDVKELFSKLGARYVDSQHILSEHVNSKDSQYLQCQDSRAYRPSRR